MLVVAASTDGHWRQAAALLLAYHRETARDMGQPVPAAARDIPLPYRSETLDPASVFDTYLLALDTGSALGGLVLARFDERSLMVKRGYVVPARRRQGVAGALVAGADEVARSRGARRLVLEVLSTRSGAIAAWRALGFVDAPRWDDGPMVQLERRVPGLGGGPPAGP